MEGNTAKWCKIMFLLNGRRNWIFFFNLVYWFWRHSDLMKHICYKHDHVEKKEVGILIFVREIKHFWCTFLQVSQACYVFLNQRRISYYTSIRQIANILTCFSCRVINQYLFLFVIYLEFTFLNLFEGKREIEIKIIIWDLIRVIMTWFLIMWSWVLIRHPAVTELWIVLTACDHLSRVPYCNYLPCE